MKIELIETDHIILINKQVCKRDDNPHICMDSGKIESALHSAFYPGSHPFQHGGIAKVAGAICFYITKAHVFLDGNKRTAAIASSVFLDLNGYKLVYPILPKKNINAFAKIITNCAASELVKDEMIVWFENHKQKV
jgi:death-on-curing family protein